MNSQTAKIMAACFIGGILFTLTAFCVAPAFWWLGTLAGLAGGYLSYEFRENLRALPVAWRLVRKESTRAKEAFLVLVGPAFRYFRQPHPFGYLSFLLTAAAFFCVINTPLTPFAVPTRSVNFSAWAIAIMVHLALIWPLFFSLVDLIAIIGGNFSYPRNGSIAYRQAARFLTNGTRRIILFLSWTIWKILFLKIWQGLLFLGWSCLLAARFLKKFCLLIHSNERLLCAVDGTLGGLGAWLWLSPTAETLAAKIAVAIFGGVLGAGWGAINYELIAKRWLKLVPQT